MNKPEQEREKLLAEAFHGEWSTGPAAEFARRAAAVARRRQGYRRGLVTVGAAAGIAAALVISLRHETAPSRGPAVRAAPTPAYEIISDDELIAQVHDRPLLVLPQENGAKKIVLLDR
jgi:hypothetical protein